LKPGAPLVMAHLGVADVEGAGGEYGAGGAICSCSAIPLFRLRPA